MPNRRSRLSLGGRLKARRRQLGLTQDAAARTIGVNRKTLAGWENGIRPEDRNHQRVADFFEWELYSVQAVLDGHPPVPLRPEAGLASVTPLPSVAHSIPDDDVVSELRKMGLPPEYLAALIETYWAEKHGLSDRFLGIARRKQADG